MNASDSHEMYVGLATLRAGAAARAAGTGASIDAITTPPWAGFPGRDECRDGLRARHRPDRMMFGAPRGYAGRVISTNRKTPPFVSWSYVRPRLNPARS